MNKRLRNRLKNNKNLQNLVVICAAILFYIILNHLTVIGNILGQIINVIAPIIYAGVIAFLLYPVIRFIEKKVFRKLRARKYLHAICVIVTVVLIFALMILLVTLVITEFAQSAKHLFNNFDSYVSRLNRMFSDALGDKARDITIFGVNILELESTGLTDIGAKMINWCTEHLEGLIGGAQSIGSNIFNILISFMLIIYMLLDAEHLKTSSSRFFKSMMEPQRYTRFAELCNRSSRIFTRYFLSNLLDSLIIGVACYIFMLIMGLPYSLIIAVVVGVTNFIPTFGPLVGAVIGGFLILLVNPLGTVWFIIYTVVTQFCDANLLKPKLFGDTTGLRPMWVLAAIIIGGGLFGVVGMLLGVPFVAIIANVVNEHIENKINRLEYSKEAEK